MLFGCVHKPYPLNRIVRIAAVRKLVTETSLIVCQYTNTARRMQYDQLSQQQLSFLLDQELYFIATHLVVVLVGGYTQLHIPLAVNFGSSFVIASTDY